MAAQSTWPPAPARRDDATQPPAQERNARRSTSVRVGAFVAGFATVSTFIAAAVLGYQVGRWWAG